MAKTKATQGLPLTIKGMDMNPSANMTATVLPPNFKIGAAISIQRLTGFSSTGHHCAKTGKLYVKAESLALRLRLGFPLRKS
ncbi:MAG: hypothetical protein V7K26_15700 [Nostoc sp.]|uniref:hypothetical protein n=1 Tax=Nostoc sp. TaxID=1180 RepID=UPI002FF224B5